MLAPNGDREINKLHTQFNIAVVTQVLLTILITISIFTINRKKDMINARGDILFYLIWGCHAISIFIPNLITVLAVYSNSMLICYPKFFYLILFHFLYVLLAVLYFFRALLLHLKSRSKNLTNLREIFVALAFTFVGIYFFILGLTTGNLSPTQYYYINYCTMPYVNSFSVNPKDFIFGVIFFASIWMLSNCNAWGIQQEAISIFLLHFVYIIIKGNNKIIRPKCYINSESLENAYRLVFMFLNCILFLWVYDDKNEIYRPVENLDVYQIKSWNTQCYKKFLEYLEKSRRNGLIQFVKNNLIKAVNTFEVFNNPECMYLLFIFFL